MSKAIREKLITSIKEESKKNENGSLPLDSYFNKLRTIFYYAKKDKWDSLMDSILTPISGGFAGMKKVEKVESLEFLTDLAIGLKSKLVHWHLLNEVGSDALSISYRNVCSVLKNCSDDKAAQALMINIRKETIDRFKAEGVEGAPAEDEASALVGDSPLSYIENVIALIEKSDLAKQAVANIDGESPSYVGNDYGAFLKYFMWFGASFQTTNPPLVKMAWEIDEAGNEEVFKDIVASEFKDRKLNCSRDKDIDELYSLFVISIVERSCRLSRDIYLKTGGKTGYVCYQVSPKYHDNGAAMAEEVKRVYSVLEKRMGGVPNISFKLPGTREGLEAAKILAPLGISITVTLCFGLFQAYEFAKVLKEGESIFSAVVVMNGRLAFPVRDELVEKGIEGGSDASRNAGVEITRHLYRKLYAPESEGGLGCDPDVIRILNASLRIYGNDIPDVTEIWGTPSITIFPNVRRAYDVVPREFTTTTVQNSTPDSDMALMKNSEIFKQAWWVEGDPEDFKPADYVTLTKECDQAVVEWPPIAATLSQFLSTYEQSVDIIQKVLLSDYCEALV